MLKIPPEAGERGNKGGEVKRSQVFLFDAKNLYIITLFEKPFQI